MALRGQVLHSVNVDGFRQISLRFGFVYGCIGGTVDTVIGLLLVEEFFDRITIGNVQQGPVGEDKLYIGALSSQYLQFAPYLSVGAGDEYFCHGVVRIWFEMLKIA
jgi:hypothetical protein